MNVLVTNVSVTRVIVSVDERACKRDLCHCQWTNMFVTNVSVTRATVSVDERAFTVSVNERACNQYKRDLSHRVSG